MKSTRVTRGVQPEEVWTAADAVLVQGERPTIERVRAHLGRGSPNTVAPLLDAWYASLGKRLANNGETDETEGQGSLPTPVLRAAKALWGRAQQSAQERAEESVRIDRGMLEQQVERLASMRIELDQEQQRLNERSESLGAALRSKDQQISSLLRQNDELQTGMAARESEIGLMRTQLAETMGALHGERDRLHEITEEHRQERGVLEGDEYQHIGKKKKEEERRRRRLNT